MAGVSEDEMQPVVEESIIAEEDLGDMENAESPIVDDVVLFYVFEFLGVRDLKSARMVCKQWARIGALPLSKKTKIFMKMDESSVSSKQRRNSDFLKAVKTQDSNGFMKFRNFELYHVDPSNSTVPELLTSALVKDTIVSLRIHGPKLKWLKPLLPLLSNLQTLGFDDTYYLVRSRNDSESEAVEPVVDDGQVEPMREESEACSIGALDVHINGHVESNPLSWLLPIAPKLKEIKLVIVNTSQLLHSVKVFEEGYVGPGLKCLRITGSFGYNWNEHCEKLPDRDGAISIGDFLALPGLKGIRSTQIHAPCYPVEWRDHILNSGVVQSLVSLQLDVYLRIGASDFEAQPNGNIVLRKTVRNPEPKDIFSAFPMERGGITMPNLLVLKIDIDYRGDELPPLEESAHMIIGTQRIFPSLVELEVDMRMFRTLPVDITRCFSTAFPNLTSLVITMASASFIKGLLLNLPKTIRILRMLASTRAAKYDQQPPGRRPMNRETKYTLNAYRITDEDFLDGGAIFLVRGLTELSVEFNCNRLTDKIATEGFLKLPYLKKLALGGHPKFSNEVRTSLEQKLQKFSVGWREEY